MGQTAGGRVRTVDTDAIVLDQGKTVARSAVAEIRMTSYVGNGREIGKLAGGAVGLMVGIVSAVAIGMKPDSAHNTGSKVGMVILGSAGLPAGPVAGYYLGRLANKELTIIHVIPGPGL